MSGKPSSREPGLVTLNRYDFLAELHRILQPKVYLEIGVQYGASLNLATTAEVAIGVDPRPLVAPQGNQVIMQMTSDDYFNNYESQAEPIDFAFIDGMHLYEYALRDFRNVELRARGDSVVVFDDVLPYNQAIASRSQPPGDWTGDVWKVYYILKEWRPDLLLAMVDTFPTGALVVRNLNPFRVEPWDSGLGWPDDTVPTEILDRSCAVSPGAFLKELRWELEK
jgi:hypothetical protein